MSRSSFIGVVQPWYLVTPLCAVSAIVVPVSSYTIEVQGASLDASETPYRENISP
jgi:hypothetical protein